MNLEEQFRELVERMSPQPVFLYGRKHEINVSADNAAFAETGAIVLIEPDQMGFFKARATGTVRDRYNIFVQFIKPVVMGEDANYRSPTVEAMRTLAAKFIDLLDQSDIFGDLPENLPGFLLVDYYDANVAGIEINIAQLTDIYPRPC